ncbi:helix-turn-helix domain-containing protein [Falsirhodobacter sp. alg1]|uniref:helix-turn-helix domain-containing protein n=1 Tax=Falsirhodobacter sp. alg1 TaxID=1472418 RepID=UPI0005EDDDA8|nr:helix-turn-helix transcriptional regulator [Falsirhodobacter sp. alg1]
MHAVDQHVGKSIRHHRCAVGMTQQKLAEAVGIKPQQIQKYESGANRVSASRLWDIAKVLDVPLLTFFTGLPDPHPADTGATELMQLLGSIPQQKRAKLFDLARSLSSVS